MLEQQQQSPPSSLTTHPLPSSPTTSRFPTSTSTTHAGGIQPSSSFFRPSRPSAQKGSSNYSPQSSVHDDQTQDTIALSTISHNDDDHLQKPSREPLIPHRKPSVANRVRYSFDRVFGTATTTARPSDEEHALPVIISAAPPSSPSPTSISPPPSFIPTPPDHTSAPPLPFTPIYVQGQRHPIRKYSLHPSRNYFFFNGRLLTGGDTPYAFLATLAVICGLAGLWFGTTCVFWWHHSRGTKAIVIIGAYLTAIVLSTMLTAATADPGILPRGLDPDPPYPATSPTDGFRAPMPRDLRVRNDVVRVKYCPTCKTYRPPRSSHCKMCDNCVDGCDHHCQWVNNCIGRRNYTTFFALLCVGVVTLILVILTSALHLWILTTPSSGHTRSFRHALSDPQGTGSAVAFCIAIALIWPVSALLGYHARLLLLNVTTIEQIRNQAHKSVTLPSADGKGSKPSTPPNPFSHGTRRRNFAEVLCRPRGYSWLDASAVATQDIRAVNPGMHQVRIGVDGIPGTER